MRSNKLQKRDSKNTGKTLRLQKELEARDRNRDCYPFSPQLVDINNNNNK